MRFFWLLLLISSLTACQERIEKFVSNIVVSRDGSLHVTETISVRAASQAVKRGIVREFPTRYTNRWGTKTVTDLTINKVQRGGVDEPYTIADAVNGIRLFIGNPNKFLDPGLYHYSISYTISRVLGFFENHDELYWNVTGSGWRLPIKQVVAYVTLPKHIPPSMIVAEAYTGKMGEQGRDYRVQILPDERIEFMTMRPFARAEGLTIVVSFPKGFIAPPTALSNFYYWIKDNWVILWTGLGFLIMLFVYIAIYLASRRRRKPIIPLFYPPKGYTPGAVRFVDRMGSDAVGLASDIMNMAVFGLITITYKKNSIFSREYILAKTDAADALVAEEKVPPLYEQLLSKLFSIKRSEVHIGRATGTSLERVSDAQKKQYRTSYGTLFSYDTELIVWLLALTLFFAIPGFIVITPFSFVCAVYLILMFVFFALRARSYSQEGQIIKDQIQGFKLYLKTAEMERFEIIGTPPTRTPELYETYLPYAVALGCEKQWTAQFAPLFAAMEAQGRRYAPGWFYGDGMYHFSPHSFSSSFAQDVGYSFSSPISSSGKSPGSSSGSGGGGSSGGGSGGGGGGGW